MKLPEYDPKEYRLSLHARNLSITTSAGERLLDDISLSIRHGEFVAIHGPSGAGKSLFATALCGIWFNEKKELGRVQKMIREQLAKTALLAEQASSVRYDGIVLYQLAHRLGGQLNGHRPFLPPDYNILRRHIGFVPQEPILDGNRTAKDNILSPARLKGIPVDEEMLEETMYQLGVTEFENQLASRLSGGQQKRVSIARALAGEPNALILDEPTADLNPEMKEETNLMLQRINHRFGMTIVSVTHEDSLATRRIEMVKGRVVSDTGESSNGDSDPAHSVSSTHFAVVSLCKPRRAMPAFLKDM